MRPASVSPWLIAVLVALATFMEVLDTTIANVVLTYIAGDMAVSTDEASWVVTTYLVANAVSLTASPFLARRLGRKAFFLICLALFTVASIGSAEAWNLDSLLLFRIFQGLAGGGMVPVSQSILADSFPPEKRGQGFALFGVAVVVAPVVGPVLGGWFADNLVLALGLSDQRPGRRRHHRADRRALPRVGGRDRGAPAVQAAGGSASMSSASLLVATFLGALEIMLDRGLIDDWFGSSFIVWTAVVCGLAFVLTIPWEARRATR